MPLGGYLEYPYVPKRKQKGRPTPHLYLHRFAYTETMRGLKDDIPTLLFYAPFALLKDACQYLCKMMSDSIGDIKIIRSHACRIKNGKQYRRVEVQIIDLDEQLMSLKSFTQMLIYRMQVICNCKIRYLKLETFLNT